jgi:hypothetical protein
VAVNGNDNGLAVECLECDPPRRFKNKAGLNGHAQFKHGHLPDNRAIIPNGKQSQMYQDLQETVDQVLEQQTQMLGYLMINGNGLANGNGNGNGNGLVNGLSNEPIGIEGDSDPEEEEPEFVCKHCKNGLTFGQQYCSNDGHGPFDWNGVGQG